MKIVEKVRTLKGAWTDKAKVRKQLRGPAHLSYAIADSITMLDSAVWKEATVHAGFFLSYDYLAGLESVLPSNLTPRYALIFQELDDRRELIAAVYMQIAELTLEQTRPEKPADRSGKWKTPLSKITDKAMQRVLTCGNLLTYGQHGVALNPEADEKLAWHGIAEVLYRVRQAEKLLGKTHFIMIKDLHDPFTKHANHLLHLSYRYVETEPNMVLTLRDEWKSHDDYLASLAAKYRSNIKNSIVKPLDEAGCTLEQLTDLAPVQEHFFTLYKAVQANASFRPFQLRPDYFSALCQMAGAGFRCSVIKKDGNILGFLITVADGDTAIAYHIGFDRAAAADLPIYLRLLHAGISDAISLGCKRVSYGRTALEPKAGLGAKPQAFGILLRHRQPILNKLIKGLLKGVEHEDAPERNPFKKVA
ncbi:MAG: GNAT family N-acetyltransferase [Burkholderiaceae bacterium]